MLAYPGCSSGGGLVLVNNLAVSASSNDPAGAAAFVSWALEPLNVTAFAESFGVFPCVKRFSRSASRRKREAEVYRRIFSARS